MWALASLTSIFVAAPVGFVAGLGFGLLVSSRYRLVRRNAPRRDYNHDRGSGNGRHSPG